jgi:hypothetical protein
LLLYTIYNRSTLIFSRYLHWFSRVYTTGTITVSLNHISKYYTQIKSSNHTLSLHGPTSSSSSLLVLIRSSSPTNFPWHSPTKKWLVVPEPNEFCRLYSRGTDMHHRKHMSRDHHPPLRDVTADTENSHLYCSVRVFRAWPRDDVLLLLRVGACLQSCGLEMGIHVTIYFFENITLYLFPRYFPLAASVFFVVLFSPMNIGVVLLSLLFLCAPLAYMFPLVDCMSLLSNKCVLLWTTKMQ